MAYDKGLADILRVELSVFPGVQERNMFGGICFMKDGQMLCGVHDQHGIFRVGKGRQKEALAIEGARRMVFTGRPVGGMVDADGDAMSDNWRRGQLLALALKNVAELPHS